MPSRHTNHVFQKLEAYNTENWLQDWKVRAQLKSNAQKQLDLKFYNSCYSKGYGGCEKVALHLIKQGATNDHDAVFHVGHLPK